MFDSPSTTFVDFFEIVVRISDPSGLILFKTTKSTHCLLCLSSLSVQAKFIIMVLEPQLFFT